MPAYRSSQNSLIRPKRNGDSLQHIVRCVFAAPIALAVIATQATLRYDLHHLAGWVLVGGLVLVALPTYGLETALTYWPGLVAICAGGSVVGTPKMLLLLIPAGAAFGVLGGAAPGLAGYVFRRLTRHTVPGVRDDPTAGSSEA